MSALLEIELGYGAPLTDEVVAMVREASITQVEVTRHGEMAWLSQRPIVSVDALAKLQALLGPKADVSVKRVISNSTTAALASFGQRNTTIENTRCNVAVAGLGLLTVNEVRHENDCCTHHLQELLGEGWRILAVCVQPDQRRPDYILGRTVEAPVHKAEPDRPRAMPEPERPEPEPEPLAPPAPPSARAATERQLDAMSALLNEPRERAPQRAPALLEDDGTDIPF